MATSFDLESVDGVAIGVGRGAITLEEMKQLAARLWQQLEGRTDRVLWDLRDAQFELEPDEVRELAEFAKANSPGGDLRTAFVVSADLEFGLVRMFEAFRGMEGATIAVFRTREPALEWLRRDLR